MKIVPIIASALFLLAPAFAAVSSASESSCGDSLTPGQRQELQWKEDEAAGEAGSAQTAELQKGFDKEYADELEHGRQTAEDYSRSHPPAPKQKVVIKESSSITLADNNVDYEFDFHFEVLYTDRFGDPLRIARFDQQGNLVEDKATPWGNAVQTADAFSDGVSHRLCRWQFEHDADGQTFPNHVEIFGEDEDGRQHKYGELWFNSEGLGYRGEKFVLNADGKRERSGAFQDPSYFPDTLPEGGLLPVVEVPRIVTLACDKCRDAADRRNDAVARLIPVAKAVNEAAAEYNRTYEAREKYAAELKARARAKGMNEEQADLAAREGMTYAQDMPPQKLKYDRQLANYRAIRAELDAADAEYMACERICREPVDEPVLAADATPPQSFGLSAGYRSVRLPELAFLGRETPGAAAPTLGLFPSERTVASADYAARFYIPFDFDAAFGPRKAGAYVEIRGMEADSRALFDRTDMAGDRLVIPGLGRDGDPNKNGFVLNYFAGLNSPESAEVTRDFVSTEARVGLDLAPLSISERLRWVYGLWGAYEAQEHGANFSAAVPGFARDIGYRQTIDVDLFKLGGHLGASYDITPDITLGVDFNLALVHVNFSGSNTLDFTGFSPQIVEDSSSGDGWDGDFTAYVDIAAVKDKVGIVIAASAFTTKGTVPVFRTPGGGARSFIDLGDSFGWVASVGLRLHM